MSSQALHPRKLPGSKQWHVQAGVADLANENPIAPSLDQPDAHYESIKSIEFIRVA